MYNLEIIDQVLVLLLNSPGLRNIPLICKTNNVFLVCSIIYNIFKRFDTKG